jgi:hypothetical protein
MKLSNHSTSRVRLFPFAVAVFTVTMVAALAGAGVGAATPTAARTGGPIAIQATLGGAATGRIVIAGSIGDWGTARSVDRNGNPDDSGNYVKVTLRQTPQNATSSRTSPARGGSTLLFPTVNVPGPS